MRKWMTRCETFVLAAGIAFALSGCGGGGGSVAGSPGALPHAVAYQEVCPEVPTGRARCQALLRTDLGLSVAEFTRMPESLRTIETLPRALGPQDLESAYGFSTNGGAGQTIALIDAYDHPLAEHDLAVYRSFYHLPACTSADGCFRRVAQDGTSNFPTPNYAWSAETAVDTQIASAVCPNCKLLLVEAKTDNLGDLASAVDRAVSLGATVVSNSYGALEWDGELDLESHWNRAGVLMTASAGDRRDRVEFPASSRYVVAVGGTSLERDGSARGFSETVWSDGAGGCSAYVVKPSWQHDGLCKNRTVADVGFLASPDLPVAVYQSDCAGPVCGWTAYSGTSVGAPAIAGLYALAGNAAAQHGAASLYSASPKAFYDVSSGGNGVCGNYLCMGTVGYDAPSGLGSPNGIAAF